MRGILCPRTDKAPNQLEQLCKSEEITEAEQELNFGRCDLSKNDHPRKKNNIMFRVREGQSCVVGEYGVGVCRIGMGHKTMGCHFRGIDDHKRLSATKRSRTRTASCKPKLRLFKQSKEDTGCERGGEH